MPPLAWPKIAKVIRQELGRNPKEILPLELDFRRELTAMTELQAALRHRADVLVPTAIPELSTERLLVMAFAEQIFRLGILHYV